ncbi:MAG TPA: alpha-amylase family glycosyl hydrolase [Acidimicrobiales bacterium]|nr:alpha-amylase family glycosyl hydrolase [Acidimicrobiales bacterium]
MALPWWQSAVVYQIYPRSFADANGDGVGDLRGIAGRLDHLAWLGVDAVWLSPIFRSPMADYGYDVADYRDVDPLFGTIDDLDHLLSELHSRGMRLLLDLVPNHTSSQHPWFAESRSSRASPKRDWYYWRDGGGDGEPPNNWTAAFTGKRAWTFDEGTGQWYLHSFLPEQPDLNWGNPEVEAAMHDVVRFWLDRGVDGFRIDVVDLIGKDPALPDDPPERVGHPHFLFHDDPRTHDLLRRLRAVIDSYPGERVTVGEISRPPRRVAAYYGDHDELHLAFNFAPLLAPWDADTWHTMIDVTRSTLDPVDAWPTWVLGNHDQQRPRTRYGTEGRARAAAVLLLTLRGTPFLYAGDELGLEDAIVAGDQVPDPGGRDGCRAPIPWEIDPPHGWNGAATWLPFPPHADVRSAEAQRPDPASMLWLHRDLLTARRGSDALRTGSFAWLDGADGVLAFERASRADRRVVVVSFVDEPRRVAHQGTIEVSSAAGRSGQPFDGSLLPDEAVVLAV